MGNNLCKGDGGDGDDNDDNDLFLRRRSRRSRRSRRRKRRRRRSLPLLARALNLLRQQGNSIAAQQQVFDIEPIVLNILSFNYKKFETRNELHRAVLMYYHIKYDPVGSYLIELPDLVDPWQRTRVEGSEEQRRKDKEYITWRYGWIMDKWDVSQVTDFQDMFKDLILFNEEIGSWDTSKAKTMRYMFEGASSFNRDISNWDVSNVKDMANIFSYATSFNQDISLWNVSNVTDMTYMFARASSFNQNISGWDVSKVLRMQYMFEDASSFNQNLSGWDVSKTLHGSSLGVYIRHDIKDMFRGAVSFDAARHSPHG